MSTEFPEKAAVPHRRLILVDDDPSVRTLIAKLLSDEGELRSVESGEMALAAMSESPADIVLLDIHLPGINGYETCRRLKEDLRARGKHAHVIIVSVNSSPQELASAFDAGADDYIVKPFDANELRSRVRLHLCLLDTTRNAVVAERQAAQYHTELQRLSLIRTSELVEAQEMTVLALAKLVEARDRETGNHLMRIRAYCQCLANEMQRSGPYASRIDEEFLQDLYRSSPLHDIGKVAISDQILLKPGRLTEGEFESMKVHTVVGAEVLKQAAAEYACGRFLKMASEIARCHHERFDGLGYPDGLAGEEIPLSARIVSVADVYDALTSDRPYKRAWAPARARQVIEQEAGRFFDPIVVSAFLERFPDFLCIQRQFATTHTSPILPSLSAPRPDGFDDLDATNVIVSSLAEDEEYVELIEDYVAEMPERIRQMQDRFRAKQFDQLCRLAHQLKGSAGSYGFESLSPCAAHLENAVRNDRSEDEIYQLLVELTTMCQRLRAEKPDPSRETDSAEDSDMVRIAWDHT